MNANDTTPQQARQEARGRPAKYASAAERQAAYRARKGKAITVLLPDDLAAELAAYMERQAMDGAGLTQSEVIAKLIRQQLLRKR